MKKASLFFVCLLFTTMIFAEPLIERTSDSVSLTTVSVDAQGNYVYTITLTPEYQEILEWQVSSPLKWIDDAVVMKINLSGDRMLNKVSETTPIKSLDKLTKKEKEGLIKNSMLKTRKERDAERSR